MKVALCGFLLSTLSSVSWGYVTFINKTTERVIVQLLTPSLKNQDDNKPHVPVFVEEFVLWEGPVQRKNAWLEGDNKIKINSKIGSRKHVFQNNFFSQTFGQKKARFWGLNDRVASAFIVKGFFNFSCECDQDVCKSKDTTCLCGVVERDIGEWLETAQFELQDGATYEISLTDDKQLWIKEGGRNMKAIINSLAWSLDDLEIVGTYFTLPDVIN
jgi:hypothetical protein